jgi:class 3 adenylate cyclase
VPGSGTRKTVTILFTDLVDSSRLSRTFDPEALWNLLTRYFEAMSDRDHVVHPPHTAACRTPS